MGKVVNVICSGCGGSGRIGVGLCGGCNGARLNKVCDACGAHHPCAALGSPCLSCSCQGVTTIVHVDESLRMAMDREIASLKRRIADLEADSACAERALIVARDAVLEFGSRPDHWAGPLLTKHIAAALIERAAFELGAIEASDCHHFKPELEK